MELFRYHGLGNDYLVLDQNYFNMELNPERIKLICDRNFGVGSDGILYKSNKEKNDYCVKIFNPDGGEAEKSGNGVRIFAKYLKDAGYATNEEILIPTLGGDVVVTYLNQKGTLMKVYMGEATCSSDKIPVIGEKREVVHEKMEFQGKEYFTTCVSVGNPHCVIFCDEISKAFACEVGPYVENSPLFPHRINTQFVKLIDKNNIQIEIYERGAGYTMASGSSSCAAAYAAYRNGMVDNDITVSMPGGKLQIQIEENNIFMTGPVCSIGKVILDNEFVEQLKEL
ncbi:diaminopimelate epimerase [Anaeromicropila populeti]|uniref:Diaminopimelate epimerase n=1 Tax=Anaeromicropila populeti TaxID=37658 RepID=A0A1I6M081_9FIRM|nr:diaminopimelate epimerase [Anaeromicropila populeti]SFS08912.1 diaminopimelate epimerase [Anaeromicropila populeti]